MKARHLEILRHALGLDAEGRGRMYRNHYCQPVDFDSATLTDIREMVSAGLMVEGKKINEGTDQYFHATDAGKRVAVENVKPVSLSRRRYLAFLNLDMGISFKEFLTCPDFAELRRNP